MRHMGVPERTPRDDAAAASQVGDSAPALLRRRALRTDARAPARSGAASPVGDAGVPLAVSGRNLPALDGLRAFAVAGVFAYHLGLGWARGGYLGVDLFFVLSGFLITSLLLEEWARTAAIKLGAFWVRRARRLLPALFLVLCAVSLFVVLNGRFGGPGAAAQIDLSGLRGDALATLFYVANWHAIFAHQSYFAQFAAPSPLQHTWSLAIEEQFYLVWPPVLLGVLWWCGRRWNWRIIGGTITAAGAVVSAVLMALLYRPGGDPTRVYFGTDTRLFDILIGATVAMAVAARPQPAARARVALHAAAPLAAGVLGVYWVVAGTTSGLPTGFMFEGGFLLCAILAAVVIADARLAQRGLLGRLLALAPLRWIGRISYGIYLWHWPVIVYMTQQRIGIAGLSLDLVRIAATLALSAASYYLVELPLRRRSFPRGLLGRIIAPAPVVLTAVVVFVATVPAVAAPGRVAASAAPTTGPTVPGAGGLENQVAVRLAAGDAVSATNPLRVLLLGDSVMYVAAPGMTAALEGTGEVRVTNRAAPGWGLSVVNWRSELPTIVSQLHPQVIMATWSWDDTWALRDPSGCRRVLVQALRLLLAPGDGVDGVIFTQFPLTGPDTTVAASDVQRATAQRTAGEDAWDRIVRSMPARFPGRVMYLPVAASVLLHGRFSTWLPPANDPRAPKSRWVRVRMVDNVHMCPAGVVRYASAVLSDLTELFHLDRVGRGWWNESWTQDPRFNTPPGACPDDHPG